MEIEKIYYTASGWLEGWIVQYKEDGLEKKAFAQEFCNMHPTSREYVENYITSSPERRIFGV